MEKCSHHVTLVNTAFLTDGKYFGKKKKVLNYLDDGFQFSVCALHGRVFDMPMFCHV